MVGTHTETTVGGHREKAAVHKSRREAPGDRPELRLCHGSPSRLVQAPAWRTVRGLRCPLLWVWTQYLLVCFPVESQGLGPHWTRRNIQRQVTTPLVLLVGRAETWLMGSPEHLLGVAWPWEGEGPPLSAKSQQRAKGSCLRPHNTDHEGTQTFRSRLISCG